MVHILSGHYPAGGSPKTMFQFFDNYNSGKNDFVAVDSCIFIKSVLGGLFTRYSYEDEEENKKHYGTSEPPKYKMELVTTPVYIFWSKTDPVSTADVIKLHRSSERTNKPMVLGY